MGIRKITAVAALFAGSMVSVGLAPSSPVSAAAGDGLRPIDSSTSMTGACTGVDASTASWSWAKPSLEFSTNGGTSYASAAGSPWGFVVCRGTTPKQYWFIIGPSTGSIKDMGTAGQAVGLQFKVTIPTKTGDTTTYAAGYSTMVSYVEQNSTAIVETKPAAVSKINFDSFDNFKTRHPECASYTMQTWNKCSIEKADEDLLATVIQHVGYTDAPITAMEETMKGLWVGANVNGFQIGMSCANSMSGASAQSAQDTITVGGKTYTRIPGSDKFRGSDGLEYTPQQIAALMGGSGSTIPGGSPGGSGSSVEPELKVTMEGTPHLKKDGSINKGSMKMFIPSAIATKCFGDSSTTALAEIAKKLTLTRTEDKEGTTTPQFTAEAVSSPVAGVVVSVAEMTFSNPNYTLKSLLRAASAGNTSGGTTTTTAPATTAPATGGSTSTPAAGTDTAAGSTGAVASSVAKISIKGKRATISVKMAKAGTIKIYSKIGTKIRLVKTLKAKAGNNTTTVTYTKGAVFTVRSATGKVIATLK